MMHPESKLFIFLTRHAPNESEIKEIRTLIDGPMDWTRFNSIAKANILRPYVLYQLQSLELTDRMPREIFQEWREEQTALKLKLEKRFVYAKAFLRRFNEEGIPVVILKGTGLAHQIYKNPFYKKSNDIDILIQPRDLPKIYEIYEGLGFVPFGERVKKDKKTQEKVAWHATPYVSLDLSLVVGTQWGIKTLLGPYKIDYDKLWKRVEPLDFQGVPVKILAPEDTFLHLCLHLGYFKTHLKDLGDIVNLLRFHRDRFDWKYFIQTAIESNASSHAYQALYLANKLCPMPEIEPALEKFKPLTWPHYRRGVEQKTRSMDDFLFLSVDWIQEVEIQMTLFLNAHGFLSKFGSFFGVWRTILFPPSDAVIKMNFALKANPITLFYYRLKTPYIVLRALAEELGWKLIGLLSIKTVIDLALSPFTGNKEKTSPYTELAKALGKTEAEVEQFAKDFC